MGSTRYGCCDVERRKCADNLLGNGSVLLQAFHRACQLSLVFRSLVRSRALCRCAFTLRCEQIEVQPCVSLTPF